MRKISDRNLLYQDGGLSDDSFEWLMLLCRVMMLSCSEFKELIRMEYASAELVPVGIFYSLKRLYDTSEDSKLTARNFIKAIDPFDRAVRIIKGTSCNEVKFNNFEKGVHIFCSRSVYSHHSIYDGDGCVYHYGGGGNMGGSIIYSTLKEFAKGDDINAYEYTPGYIPDQIIKRAHSRIGESNYNLVLNNCEHFACWCTGYRMPKNSEGK